MLHRNLNKKQKHLELKLAKQLSLLMHLNIMLGDTYFGSFNRGISWLQKIQVVSQKFLFVCLFFTIYTFDCLENLSYHNINIPIHFLLCTLHCESACSDKYKMVIYAPRKELKNRTIGFLPNICFQTGS